MILLKPGRRFRRLSLDLQQVIDLFAEGRIGQLAAKMVARNRLENNPGILRQFPQGRVKLAPYRVGGMVPGPAHVEGQFGQGIKSLNFRGHEIVNRVADASGCAHGFSY